MSQAVLARLQEKFGASVLGTHAYRGDETAIVDKARLLEVLTFLRDEPDLLFDFPVDVTAVDYLPREPRFEVVYHLRSTTHHHRIRVKCPVPENDAQIASATPLFPGWNFFEREAWDMYGIRFDGHPNHKRMFMWETFEGHPLRKDYPKEKRQPLARRQDDA